MYKETWKTTKFIDFKIQMYRLSKTFSIILTLSFSFRSCSGVATVSWEIQICAVPSHPMGFP